MGEQTMQAWRVHEVGEPRDVLRFEETEIPDPRPGQVQLKVTLAALNFPDDLMIRGKYQAQPPLPFTPGLEVVGETPEGDRVIALTALPAGGFATHCLADVDDLFPVPDSIPDEHAASMLVTYQTSHVALHHRAGIRAGEWLLVHAGAGGVGSAAIQLGLAAGARVIATAGGADKVELCRKLGAEVAVDYRSEDFVAVVKEVTGGHGADVIYDPVGGDVFDKSRRCVAWEGRILIIGFTSGRIADLPTNHALLKNYSVVGVHWGAYRMHDRDVIRRAHDDLVRLHAEGAIEPVVHAVVGLDAMPDGLELVTGRSSTGKVLVKP